MYKCLVLSLYLLNILLRIGVIAHLRAQRYDKNLSFCHLCMAKNGFFYTFYQTHRYLLLIRAKLHQLKYFSIFFIIMFKQNTTTWSPGCIWVLPITTIPSPLRTSPPMVTPFGRPKSFTGC